MSKKKSSKNAKSFLLPSAAAAVVIIAAAVVLVPKLTGTGSESTTAAQTTAAQTQNTESTAAQATQPAAEDGGIEITESEVSETAAFYDYDADGTTVEVLAVRASDGTVRLALNTCQVCKGSPYAYFVQSEDSFVCQNCKNSFSTDDIGLVHGGCNPVPITDADYESDGTTITVPASFLKQYASDFTSWKKF